MNKVRLLAYYLPQYHPTPENDLWWGKGFTEWTNVCKAKPLYKGHEQPKIPADLGFYDLRLSESRIAQAELARQYGIEGFCYWHYWFGNGKRLLERPFNEVLKSGTPDFPFCLAWANHSWWKKTWDKDKKNDKLLIEQKYPGIEDYENHFYELLPAFRDHRYVKVDGKPLFSIFAPLDFDDVSIFINVWRKLALENGLNGIYFVGQGAIKYKAEILSKGFDAINDASMLDIHALQSVFKRSLLQLKVKLLKLPRIYRYSDAMKYFTHPDDAELNILPTIVPNWDHTPRSGAKGIIFSHSTPSLFKKHVKEVFSYIKGKPEEYRIVFIKSWNEWGEGNYLEPDLKYGLGYLENLRDAINESFI